jgi:hypothetical protein
MIDLPFVLSRPSELSPFIVLGVSPPSCFPSLWRCDQSSDFIDQTRSDHFAALVLTDGPRVMHNYVVAIAHFSAEI